MSIIPKHREGRSGHEYYYVGMTTSACGVVPRRQPDSRCDRVRFSLAALDSWVVPFNDGCEAAAWA